MVSNQRTLVQWWMLPFNNQSFWGGSRGGASCWQCQGPYQLESVSATETNNWDTALLHVHDQTDTYSQYWAVCTVSNADTMEIQQRVNKDHDFNVYTVLAIAELVQVHSREAEWRKTRFTSGNTIVYQWCFTSALLKHAARESRTSWLFHKIFSWG